MRSSCETSATKVRRIDSVRSSTRDVAQHADGGRARARRQRRRPTTCPDEVVVEAHRLLARRSPAPERRLEGLVERPLPQQVVERAARRRRHPDHLREALVGFDDVELRVHDDEAVRQPLEDDARSIRRSASARCDRPRERLLHPLERRRRAAAPLRRRRSGRSRAKSPAAIAEAARVSSRDRLGESPRTRRRRSGRGPGRRPTIAAAQRPEVATARPRAAAPRETASRSTLPSGSAARDVEHGARPRSARSGATSPPPARARLQDLGAAARGSPSPARPRAAGPCRPAPCRPGRCSVTRHSSCSAALRRKASARAPARPAPRARSSARCVELSREPVRRRDPRRRGESVASETTTRNRTAAAGQDARRGR